MNRIAGIITFPLIGKAFGVPVQPLGGFKLNLDGGEWDMGIDQSTSCTGICLERADGGCRILLDIARDRNLEACTYYRDLYRVLKMVACGCSFRMVIMEKPVPKNMMASRVLQELKGRVEEWVGMIPEFKGAVVDSLFQQTWKSYVVDKSKGKNRWKNKRCIAEDLSDRFPMVGRYLDTYPFKDYDSFDACGILFGYRKYAFCDDGSPKIHGTIEKRHRALVGYQWLDASNPGGAIGCLGDFVRIKEPAVLNFNEKYNLYENIRMASSNNDFVLTVVPHGLLGGLMWKYGVDPDDESKFMVMYVLRVGSFSAPEIRMFKGLVPWNEEVLGN